MCPCDLHLYHTSALHHILLPSLFKICLLLPEGPLPPGTAASQSRLQHKHKYTRMHRSAFVSLPPTAPSGSDLTVPRFTFSSDPTVLSKLHRHGNRDGGHLLLAHTQKRASFAFSLIQILFTHEII